MWEQDGTHMNMQVRAHVHVRVVLKVCSPRASTRKRRTLLNEEKEKRL
jgi:hypothetical protein